MKQLAQIISFLKTIFSPEIVLILWFLYSIAKIMMFTKAASVGLIWSEENIFRDIEFIINIISLIGIHLLIGAGLVARKKIAFWCAFIFAIISVIDAAWNALSSYFMLVSAVLFFALLISWHNYALFEKDLPTWRKKSLWFVILIGIYFVIFSLLNAVMGTFFETNIAQFDVRYILLPITFVSVYSVVNLEAYDWFDAVPTIGLLIVLVLYVILFVKSSLPHGKQIVNEEIAKQLSRDQDSLALLKITGDLDVFQLQEGRVWYKRYKSYLFVLGDIIFVSKQSEKKNLKFVQKFIDFATNNGELIMVVQCGEYTAKLFNQCGYRVIKQAKEAVVDLNLFDIQGASAKDMRYAKKKLEKDGVTLEYLPFAQLSKKHTTILHTLKREWLNDKKNSVGQFTMGYTPFQPEVEGYVVLVKDPEFGYIAALSYLPYGEKNYGLALDYMISSPFLKPGLMDGILTQCLQDFCNMGIHFVSLGLAIKTHKNSFTNKAYSKLPLLKDYVKLAEFKEKFLPAWSSRYMVVAGYDTSLLQFGYLSDITSGKAK